MKDVRLPHQLQRAMAAEAEAAREAKAKVGFISCLFDLPVADMTSTVNENFINRICLWVVVGLLASFSPLAMVRDCKKLHLHEQFLTDLANLLHTLQ